MAAIAAPLLIWQDAWSVGISTIDYQHQKLVSILNELHEAMSRGQGSRLLSGILDRLVTYTKEHFSAEERLLEAHRYFDLGAHRAEHRHLTGRVLELQSEFVAGRVTLSVEVMQFLSEWLKNHILGADKRYAAVLNARGVR
jgi:hemerythrin-like metal-binding protein